MGLHEPPAPQQGLLRAPPRLPRRVRPGAHRLPRLPHQVARPEGPATGARTLPHLPAGSLQREEA